MTAGAVARHSFKKGIKVAHLVADYAYGHEMLRGFKRAQAAIGAETVGEILHPFGAADYSTFMPRLRSMRPDFLCISNFGRDQANSIKQAVDFGLKQQAKIVVPVILHNQRLAVGPEVFEGVVGGAELLLGPREPAAPARRRSTMPTGPPMAARFRPITAPMAIPASVVIADGNAGGRRHRYRQGDRGAGRAEI